jgi:hypothetical protein
MTLRYTKHSFLHLFSAKHGNPFIDHSGCLCLFHLTSSEIRVKLLPRSLIYIKERGVKYTLLHLIYFSGPQIVNSICSSSQLKFHEENSIFHFYKILQCPNFCSLWIESDMIRVELQILQFFQPCHSRKLQNEYLFYNDFLAQDYVEFFPLICNPDLKKKN